MEAKVTGHSRQPWNKGKLVGQELPLKVRTHGRYAFAFNCGARSRPALFDLGIYSKLRACDLVKLRAREVCHGNRVATLAIVLQQKTQRPVQFGIAASTREALEAWITVASLKADPNRTGTTRPRATQLRSRKASGAAHAQKTR